MSPDRPPRRGEVWWVAFDPSIGGEIRKTRPAIIVSNDAIAPGLNAVTAAAAGGNASNQDNPVNRIADIVPSNPRLVVEAHIRTEDVSRVQQGRIRPGSNLLLSGFGGGLAWGTGLFQW